MTLLNQNNLWNESLANLLSRAPTQDIWEYIYKALQIDLQISSLSVIEYLGDTMPVVLYSDASDDPNGDRIQAYLQGAYLLDPFYRASLEGPLEGYISLVDLSPSDFEEGEYYNTFFSEYGLKDEVNIFFPVENKTMVAISIGRDESSSLFGARTKESLTQAYPFFKGIVQSAVKATNRNAPSLERDLRDGFHARLKSSLEGMGTSILTPREKTILDYLLAGYSVRAAAERLGVAEGTVRIHRHSVYNKLDINSQTELFALVLESLKLMKAGGQKDPLAGLLPPPV